MSYINGAFRIIEELIRMVNKLKKLIAKTLLYVVLVESDQFLRQTFDPIWTKNVKFAKKKNLERSSSYAGILHGQGILACQSSFHFQLVSIFVTKRQAPFTWNFREANHPF